MGSRGSSLVRALASLYQCGSGLILGFSIISGLSLLLVLVLASRGFLQVPDHPTPKTGKSGDFEKKQRKTGRLGSQTRRFPKYVLNEIKMVYFLFQGILYHNICAVSSSK